MHVVVSTYADHLSYLSLSEAKEHLRVTGTDSDTEISQLIEASCQILSNVLGYVMNGEDVKIFTNSLVNSFQYNQITKVSYLSAKNTYSDYPSFDISPSHFEFEIVPADGAYNFYEYGYKYRITCETGFPIVAEGDKKSFPKELKHCLKLIVHDLYEQRGDMLPVNLYRIPRGVHELAFNHCWRVFV